MIALAFAIGIAYVGGITLAAYLSYYYDISVFGMPAPKQPARMEDLK